VGSADGVFADAYKPTRLEWFPWSDRLRTRINKRKECKTSLNEEEKPEQLAKTVMESPGSEEQVESVGEKQW